MIYLKSVCVGLAFVLGAFYAVFFLAGIVLRIVTRPHGQDTMGFSISLHSPIFWLLFVVFFACGYLWAYRRFSKESMGTLK
jgi:hypothetical protein